MKIQLIIAVNDRDYVDHLSRELTERYAEVFEITVCTSPDRIGELTGRKRFDAGIFDAELARLAELSSVRLPLMVWDGVSSASGEAGLELIKKYQRISRISADVLERYSKVAEGSWGIASGRANVTAVWSPSGGSGKTTAALAYCARKASQGLRPVYLDLQPFSASDIYFPSGGKSISALFEQLDSAELLGQGIRQEDHSSGIFYFGKPDNYDDINILTKDDIEQLITGCARSADELVIDLGSTYDAKTRHILELADCVMVVLDATAGCRAKWQQFAAQHDTFELIKDKTTLVLNRGAAADGSPVAKTVSLPIVQSTDPAIVFKTLSSGYFD